MLSQHTTTPPWAATRKRTSVSCVTPLELAQSPYKDVVFASRPDIGHSGRAIQIRANFFGLTSLPQSPIHHYEINIYPEVPPAKNRRVYQIWEQEIANTTLFKHVKPVFDGRKNLYSMKQLPLVFDSPTTTPSNIHTPDSSPTAITNPNATPEYNKHSSDTFSSPPTTPCSSFLLNYYEDGEDKNNQKNPKQFTLTLRYVTSVPMTHLHRFLTGASTETPYEAMNALDILLRQRPSLMYTTVGRCFYTPDSAQDIANGASLWQGFHQSIRPSRGQMLINLDVSATAFYQPGPVVEMVAKLLGKNGGAGELRGPLSDKDRIKVEKALKGLKISVTHRGSFRRKYRVTKLTTTSADRTMFYLGDSTEEEDNVANYFNDKYGMELYFPHLPCLVVGDPSKHVYLPLEVCEIVDGQRHLRKLNERQTAEMIKFTCQPPHIRSNKISAGITILQNRDNDYLKEFNVKIGHEMTIVDARVLPAPSISYHPASKEPVITPREGAWNLRDKMVAQGITLRSWAVIAFGNEHDYPLGAIQKFITLLVQTCEECGVFIENRQPPISFASPHGNIEKTLIDSYMVAGDSFQERPQMLICILPNTGVPLYAEIKRVSDTVIGIATQCIQAKHMFAAKRQYCANVCLKMNVKLGGMNSYLSSAQLPFVSAAPTIIFGADVTHPAPGSGSNQSIAALVGSMDAQCSRYSAAIRVQKGRHEIIQDLTSMVVELLKTFYQTCGAKPERVIFFRDGISEGQFGEVLSAEVEAIKKGCLTLESDYQPTITYAVVQKRHHARFFPIKKEDSDKSGNVLPGTVVETGITHPSEFDFYLCSHPGLQGTSKPTHYHVLHDENRFTADSLQELIYRMCYLYCRATRSVSVCPPAYYAHLVAARARFHANETVFTPSQTTSTYGGWNEQSDFENLVSGMEQLTTASPPPGMQVGGMAGGVFMGGGRQMKRYNRFSVISEVGVGRQMLYGTVKPELTKVMYFM